MTFWLYSRRPKPGYGIYWAEIIERDKTKFFIKHLGFDGHGAWVDINPNLLVLHGYEAIMMPELPWRGPIAFSDSSQTFTPINPNTTATSIRMNRMRKDIEGARLEGFIEITSYMKEDI